MSKNFDFAFQFTIGNEGKYSNHPRDRGGPTKYGITQADLSQWLEKPASIQDVKDMSLETAKAIYSAHYWNSLGLDHVHDSGVATCMFDIGVVCGISIPPKFAQSICNAHGAGLVQDGHLGPLSFAAINFLTPAVFIRDFSVKTESRFRGIVARNPSQGVFLKGWLARSHRLLTLI